MTDQQQRNADIAKAVEHALNQKDIDAREWERQSKQWEERWRVVTAERDAERAYISSSDDAMAAIVHGALADLGTRTRLDTGESLREFCNQAAREIIEGLRAAQEEQHNAT